MRRSIVVFAARESADILVDTIEAVSSSCCQGDTIDVLVNGNRALASALRNERRARCAESWGLRRIRIWSLPIADKATAWNVFLHQLWEPGTLACFIDGYAHVEESALGALAAALKRNPSALAATGVPSVGRSAARIARSMLSQGGFHGNLHAINATTMTELRASHFRLPAFLYRTDALIGAVLCFGLDPARNIWNPERIAVCPEATWRNHTLRWWSPADLRTHANRYLRQAQGRLENAAYRYLFVEQRAPIATLPADVLTLLDVWLAARPQAASRIISRDPLTRLALRRLRRSSLLRLEAGARENLERIY